MKKQLIFPSFHIFSFVRFLTFAVALTISFSSFNFSFVLGFTGKMCEGKSGKNRISIYDVRCDCVRAIFRN